MAWLLDTNAVISLITRRSDALLRRVEAAEPGTLASSSVVAHELYFGAYRSQKIEYNLETLRLLFADLVIVDLDREDARTAAEIRAALTREGTPIGPYDVLIAGTGKGEGRCPRHQQHRRVSTRRGTEARRLDAVLDDRSMIDCCSGEALDLGERPTHRWPRRSMPRRAR